MWRVHNSVDSFYQRSWLYYRVAIRPDGTVTWSYGSDLRTSCNLDVSLFPFDNQTCQIVISNAVYTEEKVTLVNRLPSIELDQFSDPLWNITGGDAEQVVYQTDDNQLQPMIIFTLYLSRKSTYYVINLMVPSIMLTSITLATFWIPIESGEKISYGITSMLSFAVMQLTIESYMPVSSDYRPMLGKTLAY